MINQNTKNMLLATRLVKKYAPIIIIPKSLSKLHKFIGKILFFNKDYMKSFWTTIGYTVAYPEDYSWETVFHEGIHVKQAEKYTRPGFALLYLFPQILALLSLLAIFFGPIWLLALLFLAPLPAPFRMLFELEAYEISVAVHYWTGGKYSQTRSYIDDIVNIQFAGPNYWYMWIFKSYVEQKLNRALHNAFFYKYKNEYDKAIIEFLERNDLVAVRGLSIKKEL